MHQTPQRSVYYVELSTVATDEALQGRALGIDANTVREYAEQMQAGATFPPVLVFYDGKNHWIADGYHRMAARQACGQTTLLAEVRAGSREDAIWAGCAANKAHGLRRTNADKRCSVLRALLHPRGKHLSDRQISYHCGVHHYTVGRLRRELEEAGSIEVVECRDIVRGDATYQQKIAGIQASNTRRGGGAPAGSTTTCDEDVCSAPDPNAKLVADDSANPTRAQSTSAPRTTLTGTGPVLATATMKLPSTPPAADISHADHPLEGSDVVQPPESTCRAAKLVHEAESSVAELVRELGGCGHVTSSELARFQVRPRLDVLAKQISALAKTMPEPAVAGEPVYA